MGGKHRLPSARWRFARQFAASTLLAGAVGFVGWIVLSRGDAIYTVVPEPIPDSVPTAPAAPTPAPPPPSSAPPEPTTSTTPPPQGPTVSRPVPPTSTRPPAPPPPKPVVRPPAPKPPPPPSARACPTTGFGGVKPHVAAVAHHVAGRFNLPPSRVGGVGDRPLNPSSDHPRGRAIDFVVLSDRALGDRIAAYLVANADRFAITYVIFNSRISYGGAWQPYVGYSPHRDHIHASFRSSPPATLPTC